MKNGKKITADQINLAGQLDLDEMNDFSERIINSDLIQVVMDLMKKNNINTQKELADRLGVSAPYISELFAGDKKVNLSMLVKLQQIFKIRFKIVTSDMVVKQQKQEAFSTFPLYPNYKSLSHPNFSSIHYGEKQPPISRDLVRQELTSKHPGIWHRKIKHRQFHI